MGLMTHHVARVIVLGALAFGLGWVVEPGFWVFLLGLFGFAWLGWPEVVDDMDERLFWKQIHANDWEAYEVTE